jgi:hypothetical protein
VPLPSCSIRAARVSFAGGAAGRHFRRTGEKVFRRHGGKMGVGADGIAGEACDMAAAFISGHIFRATGRHR